MLGSSLIPGMKRHRTNPRFLLAVLMIEEDVEETQLAVRLDIMAQQLKFIACLKVRS